MKDVTNFIGVGSLPQVAVATRAEFLILSNAISAGVDGGAVHGIVRSETVGEEFGCGGSGAIGKGMGAWLDASAALDRLAVATSWSLAAAGSRRRWGWLFGCRSVRLGGCSGQHPQ